MPKTKSKKATARTADGPIRKRMLDNCNDIVPQLWVTCMMHFH